MALLSEQDRQTVRGHLAVIEEQVRLIFFTQTFGAPDTVTIAKQVLDEIVCLNDHLTLEEVNFVLEQDRARQYGVEQIPTIVLLKGDQDTRIRFLGAPAGYEFMSLIEAVILADAGQPRAGRRARDRAAQHPGVRDTDVPALPSRRDPGASTGGRESADHGVVRRSVRVHGSIAQVPRDRRSEDDREWIDRDPWSATRRSIRANRRRRTR